jgi:hypothetical protein
MGNYYCETAASERQVAATPRANASSSPAPLQCRLSLTDVGTKLIMKISPQSTRDSPHTKLAPLPSDDDGSKPAALSGTD